LLINQTGDIIQDPTKQTRVYIKFVHENKKEQITSDLKKSYKKNEGLKFGKGPLFEESSV
jgi:hypothetical protein